MNLTRIRWRVFASTGDVFVVTPRNKYTFKWRQYNDSEQFYRLDINGSLTIGGRFGGDEYSLLKALDVERYRYQPQGIRCEVLRNDGTWSTFWRGEFSGNDYSDVDECSCTITFKPRMADIYKCILDNADKELNIPSLEGEVSTFSPVFNSYEFQEATVPPSGDYWQTLYSSGGRYVWVREFIIMPCIAGVPVDPPADTPSWNLLDNNCATNGTAKYVRYTTIDFGSVTVEAGDCVWVEGELVAIPPPAAQTLAVNVNTADLSSDLPEIIGASYVIGNWLGSGQPHQRQTYRVVNPRFGATYNWTVPTILGVTIASGQGTAQIVVDWGETPWGSVAIQVQEVNDCGTVSAAPFPVNRVFADPPSWPDQSFMSAPSETCQGDTFTVTMPVRHGEPGYQGYRQTYWSVGAGAVIVAHNDNSCQVQVTAGSGSVQVKYSYTPGVFPVVGISVPIVAFPAIDGITGPTEACQGNTAAYYTTRHAGWSYFWSVPDGWEVLSGQGTSQVLINFGGDIDGEVRVKVTRAQEPQWIQVADCTETDPPLFWQYQSSVGETYNHGRLLSYVTDKLAAFVCAAFQNGVSSDFFQWAPINPSSINYVNNGPSDLKYVTIHNKGDVLLTDADPDVYQAATKAPLTWAKLTQFFRVMWNVFWYVDTETLRLRFEHLKFFETQDIVDIPDAPCPQYKYEREQLPRAEKFIWSEARNGDFVGAAIEYDLESIPIPRPKNPGVSDRTEERSPGDVTTDLPYIQLAELDEISRTGWVILKNVILSEDGGEYLYQVMVEVGALTGMPMANGGLSWANLHRDWHTWGRPVSNGYMNNVFTQFNGRNPNRRETFTVQRCLEDLVTFDPFKRFRSQIGVGKLEEAEIDLIDEKMTFQLAHQPPE